MMIMAIPALLAIASVADGASVTDRCLPVAQDRIYARDVVPSIGGFAALDGEVVLGYAPIPGARRVFAAATLQRIAQTQGVNISVSNDVCFERSMMRLTAEDIREAMQLSESNPEAKIQLRSWSPRAVPQGKLILPRAGLQSMSSGIFSSAGCSVT